MATWSCSDSASNDPLRSSAGEAGAGGADEAGSGGADEAGAGGADEAGAGATAEAGAGGADEAGAGGTGGETNEACRLERTCECIEHDTCRIWGANFGCPATIAKALAYCGELLISVTRYASSCGGTVLHASSGVQNVDYTFDQAGALVAVDATGDQGDCGFWGESCARVGVGTLLCSGAGGAGGAEGS